MLLSVTSYRKLITDQISKVSGTLLFSYIKFFQNFRNEDKFEGLSVIDYDDLYKIPPGNVAPFYSVILKNDANTDFRLRLLLVCPCRNYLK